ncbi:ribonuclease H family protein [Clostridium sp. HCP1S3_B4]|uniref:ribonuclease H family protein n=1 Tax=unclassified Clostridium TaxID=2614128 RepID=UPI0016922065|nr:ribonuclease H family protein [Clostridiales bacterium]MDY2729414.1 ribonuclease H family protein [Clostridium sp.]NLK23410.1 reverse transcriptase-like protein [Clostridiales bacterium]
MAGKIYAIKEGNDPLTKKKVQNIMVNSWDECLKYVKGIKGAKYKSFKTKKEAEEYFGKKTSLKKSDNSYPKDCLHIYVDGSYNVNSNKYSYGLVAVLQDTIVYIEGNSFECDGKNSNRQISGELKAAIRAVQYSLDNNYEKVVIFHDYMGICNHATGEWERKEESSKDYYKKMQSFMKQGIEIIFVKVDSHTGDFYNELADEVCKMNLNIDSDKVVAKFLKNNIIKVNDKSIKDLLLKVAPGFEGSIQVLDNRCQKATDDTIYSKIIKLYNEDKNSSLNLINNLSHNQKNNLIKFLLNKLDSNK